MKTGDERDTQPAAHERPDASRYCFEQMVSDERARSERYNRYFSIITLTPVQEVQRDVWRLIAADTRSCDIVGVLADGGLFYRLNCTGGSTGAGCPDGKLVMLLPETDSYGAGRLLARIAGMIKNPDDVRIGSACYPDDATTEQGLLEKAGLL